MADYYAIIRTMEMLEMQYIRGAIPPAVYEKECQVEGLGFRVGGLVYRLGLSF